VIGGVVAVAAEVGHVDTANERDLAIDHQRLLVVAVKRVLAGIELAADLRLADQPRHALTHLGPGGVKHRDRRAGPRQHADVDALGSFRKQRSEHG
jgi:hypothetical protein